MTLSAVYIYLVYNMAFVFSTSVVPYKRSLRVPPVLRAPLFLPMS